MAATERDPGSPEAALRALLNLHTAGRFEEALVEADRLVERAPDRPSAHYNRACVLARLQRSEDAIEALGRAIDFGWREGVQARLDPDLRILRAHPGFDAALERMADLAAAEAIRTGPLRSDAIGAIAEEIAATAPALLARYHVPGAALVLVRDGRVALELAIRAEGAAAEDAVDPASPVVLAAPSDLAALMVAARLDVERRIDLDRLFVVGLASIAEPSGSRGRSVIPTAFAREPGVRVEAPDHEAFDSARLCSWPVVRETAASTVLATALEEAAGERFLDLVTRRVFDPAGLAATRLAVPAEIDRAIVGYSALGSPVPIGRDAIRRTGRRAWSTTASDLARLMIAAGVAPASSDLEEAQARRRFLDAIGFRPDGLGLHVDSAETREGLRLQVADVTGGCGCLMRWYPTRGDGVVVVFNASPGTEAALRLAQQALGGGRPVRPGAPIARTP